MMHISVDLDSTLCDTRHRKGIIEQFVKNNLPIDWDVYAKACAEDPPTSLVPFIRDYQRFGIWHVVSGRSEGARAATWQWLNKHGLNPYSVNLENHQTELHSSLGHSEWKARRVIEVARYFPIQTHFDDWAPVAARIEELSDGLITGVTVLPPGMVPTLVSPDNPGELTNAL